MFDSADFKGESGSGFLPAVLGLLVLVTIIQLVVSMARLSDAESRLGAIAQDTARLEAGALYQEGLLSTQAVLNMAHADLGSLSPYTSIETSPQGSLLVVTIRTQVPIATLPALPRLTTTVTARAAILQERIS